MSFFRPEIEALEPYVPGRQPGRDVIKLNANENPYPPAPGVRAALAALDADDMRLYPSAVSERLRAEAASAFGVSSDWIIAGNGSDEVLAWIVRVFLDRGDEIAVVDPTYTLYEVLAAMQGARTRRHPLSDTYALPAAFFGAKAKVTFLPNPNAQTGTLFPEEAIRRLCAGSPGIVVIDEAYGDFAGVTMMPLVREHGNLIVTRTLSKAQSLAGMRVGFAVSTPAIIAGLCKVKDSYNVNVASQAAGAAALADGAHLRATVAKIVATRERFAAALARLGWRVVPSAANFVLAAPPRGTAREWLDALEAKGFLVRHFNTPRLDNMLRISIGTDEQMHALRACIDALRF